MFEKIKKWYEKGHWTKKMVRDAAYKGRITTDQYREITGDDY